MASGGSHRSMAISKAKAGNEDQVRRLYGLSNLLPEPPPSSGVGGDNTALRLPPLQLARPAAMAAASTGAGGTAGAFPVTEGQARAGKAAARRRRPRAASRRAPTTVLSTDAYNFRAMVQQFTGAHPIPFQAGSGGQAAVPCFGLGGGAAARLYRPEAAVFPFGSAQQQLQLYERGQLFSPERSDHDSSASGGDPFLQGYVGEPQGGHADVFLPAEGVSPSQDQVTTTRASAPTGSRSAMNGPLF